MNPAHNRPRSALVAGLCLALPLGVLACNRTPAEPASAPAAPTATTETPANAGAGGGTGANAPANNTGPLTRPTVTVPSGSAPTSLQTEDIRVGTGAEAHAGQRVDVQYSGVAWSTHREFDSSWNRGEPFSFTLGQHEVIPGWDRGVAGMKVGGRRKLIIPPELGYGARGAGQDIGPNETLVFVVDLVGVH